MNIAVVTLFPEMFEALTAYGVCGRAVERGLVKVAMFNPRRFTEDRHQTVDDRPYGGGPGMVMMNEPLRQAVHAAKEWLCDQRGEPLTGAGVDSTSSPAGQECAIERAIESTIESTKESGLAPDPKVVYLSPQGQPLTQATAVSLQRDNRDLVLVAGRYEGIDERFIETEVDEELSIGDYVLSGGELPAMVLMDVLIRLHPQALGDEGSAQVDSFMNGLLDYPHYTRPDTYRGRAVPAVLLSGDHGKIAQWREQQALGRTWERRPDLMQRVDLSPRQQALLDSYRQARSQSSDDSDRADP